MRRGPGTGTGSPAAPPYPAGCEPWPRRLMAIAVLTACLAACGGDDRPSDDAWRGTWDQRRMLVPDADAIVARGAELCDELIGELRVELPDLRPTPAEALDELVDEWIALAESIAFECPSDQREATSRRRTLDLIAAEIDAGLDADDG